MKSLGIVREVDELGRVVIPIETRRMLMIELGDPLEFFVDDTIVMMRKYNATACLFCNVAEDTRYFKGKFVCSNCLADLVPGTSHASKEMTMNSSAADKLRSASAESKPLVEGDKYSSEVARKRSRTVEALERLKEQKREYPEANQKELAEQMGISQGRVSQLIKLLTL